MLSLNPEVPVVYDATAPAATAEIEGWSKQWDAVIRSALTAVMCVVFATLAFHAPN
jgi:hypothetical protein